MKNALQLSRYPSHYCLLGEDKLGEGWDEVEAVLTIMQH